MKVAVVGATGVVGAALADFLSYSQKKGTEIVRYSRSLEKEGEVTKDDVNSCEIAFICVPTPMFSDKFGVDLSALSEVFTWIDTPIIVIKSTVPPGTTEKMHAYKPESCVLHNPEFLTETNAFFDTLHETRIIIGYCNAGDLRGVDKLLELYKKHYGADVKYMITKAKVSEMVKYTTNAFLATKVIFCNEIYNTCKKLGISYDELRELWLLDERVGRSHTLITPERGYGGMCLPKDVKGLIEFSDSELMKTVHNLNKRIRNE